jgi:hypothetical protein
MENENYNAQMPENDGTENTIIEERNPEPKRTRGLSFVLVFSMIGSAWGILANAIVGATTAFIAKLVESNNNQLPSELMDLYTTTMGFTEEQINEALSRLLEIPAYHSYLMALLSGVSLAGVILMWKLKKLGFHLYTMAQIIMLIMLALLGRAHIGPGDIMLTVLFVVFYALAFFKKNDSIQK